MEKIFIAIPTTGNIRTELLSFLLNITHNPKYLIRIDTTTTGDICHNRNYLVERFLKTDSKYLLFCDSDIVPPLNILNMIEDNKDVVSAVNFTWKGNELIPLIMKEVKGGYKADNKKIVDKNEIIEIDAIGLGCVLIKRGIFEELKKPYFEFKFNNEGLLINGEDFNFCEKIKKLGIKIWVDKRYMTNHFSVVNLKTLNDWLVVNSGN